MTHHSADPTANLIFLTNRVARQLTALTLSEMEFEGWRPQGTHLGLVADLVGKDGVRQQDLAMTSIKDKGTVARALHALEREEIVRRVADHQDRRQKLIYLTEKGRRMWSYASNYTQEAITAALLGIDEADRRCCISVLSKMYHTLNQELTLPQATNS